MNINRSVLKFLLWSFVLLLLVPTFFFVFKFILKEPFDSPVGFCPPGFVSLMTTGVFLNSMGTKIVCFPKTKSISTIDECFEPETEESTGDFQKTDYHTNDTNDHKVLRDPQKNAYGVNKSDDCVLDFVRNHEEIDNDNDCKKIADIGYMVKCRDIIISRKDGAI